VSSTPLQAQPSIPPQPQTSTPVQPHHAVRASGTHRLVIVGGGAGGLELATRLGDRLGSLRSGRRARVTLVDLNATHIWKPLLHEVAAGSMDPNTHQIAYAAQASWHHFEFQQGALTGVDRAQRRIQVGEVRGEDGELILPAREIPYDTLVLAVGSVTNFFGVPGAAVNALALDTAAQAERFRRRLLAACMRAQANRMTASDGARGVSVVIIGAGATGVELSAELRTTAQVLAAYGIHDLDPAHDVRIHLIEAGPRVLPALPDRVSGGITRLLGRLDVDVLTGERVTEVAPECVRMASGREIASDLTVWAAGIAAPPVTAQLQGLTLNRLGQIEVEPSLQVKGDPDIFALGDCAACAWPETKGWVPPRAQAAHQQADHLVQAIERRLAGRPLRPFRYRDFGSLVSLGDYSAVGNLMGGVIAGSFLVEGLFARLMYASLYRMHMRALLGFWGMVVDAISHWLRRTTHPRVKLH
jgi:NADH dehydrogenase